MKETNITRDEIVNLKTAIDAAIKQSSLLMFICSMIPETKGAIPFTIKDILELNSVYSKALETIEKIEKGKY